MSEIRTWLLRIDDSPWGESANVVIPPFTEQLKGQPLVEVIELAPVMEHLEKSSALIGELLERISPVGPGSPHGLEMLALLGRANDVADLRDSILRASVSVASPTEERSE